MPGRTWTTVPRSKPAGTTNSRVWAPASDRNSPLTSTTGTWDSPNDATRTLATLHHHHPRHGKDQVVVVMAVARLVVGGDQPRMTIPKLV